MPKYFVYGTDICLENASCSVCNGNKGRVLVISVDMSAWEEFADACWVPHGLVDSILHFTEGRVSRAGSHTILLLQRWFLWEKVGDCGLIAGGKSCPVEEDK